MNHKSFHRSMILVFGLTFAAGSTLQAQTSGTIPKFLDSEGSLGDSVARETSNGAIGIQDESFSPPARLFVQAMRSINGTGLISLGTGTEVIGTGTRFLSELHPGDFLGAASTFQFMIVERINSDTSLNTVDRYSVGFENDEFMFQLPNFQVNQGPLTVNGDHNVGIGTLVPREKLTVQTNTGNYGLVHTDGTVVVGSWVGAGSAGSLGGWFGTKSNHPLRFFAGSSPARMAIDLNGNVGIGTTTPDERLDVAGTVKAMTLRARLVQLTGADFSEKFDVQSPQNEIEPGMVVAIDAANPGKLEISGQAYNRRVAGILSGAGGIDAGMIMGQPGSLADGSHSVALSGRVYVWADASNGPIAPGDLLTTANRRGHAMKVTNHAKAQGAVLGKAMTGLREGRGLVLTLVSLQ